ncbi:synemin [Hemicordylus capensis]|uniref:synemin n=1 Tax=Hemicordylus capensis TaxID=884348 RepID=UPI002304639F|nr:synemin [Hemicordylus capensis]
MQAWDEQSELRELNSRLSLYVSRVRQLEQENRCLAQEIAALRGRAGQDAPRWEAREREVAELRLVAAELRRAHGEAELERDALRQELARLERLGAQSVELRRRRLEPELAEQRELLEHLRADCAALAGLLERLGAERGRLQEARRQRPAARPALMPPPPPPARRSRSVSRREAEESCALVLSWSCERSLERYEAELQALQELEARRGWEDAQELRAGNEQSRRQLQELHRRCGELSALAERLEQERLAQQERHGAGRAEYQMMIDALEEEKLLLVLSIAEYLKDYHDLLQVKAGLTLEIATYRALLEGESSQWILTWDEQHGRKLPQGVRNMLYEYRDHRSACKQEKGKRTFPAIQNVEARFKTPVTNLSSSAVYSSRTKSDWKQTAAPGKTLRRDAFTSEYHPSAATRRDEIRERIVMDQRENRSFTRPSFSRGTDVQQRKLPERIITGAGMASSFSKEATTASRNISENVRMKVGLPTTLPSYGLTSSAKETKYERTVEGTETRVNEQIKDNKPGKEGNFVLLEEREQKERLVKDTTDFGHEKIGKKSTGVERSVNIEKKAGIKQGTDESKHTVEELIIKDHRKEDGFMGDKVPKDGQYVRWEERVRVDTSAKDFPTDIKTEESRLFHREKTASTAKQSKEAVEIPIRSEVRTHDQTLKSKNIEITSQDSKPSVGKQKGDETMPKLPRESKQDGATEEDSAKITALLTESIAENIVSDILKGFVQEPSVLGSPPDTKVTFEKTEVSEGGKVKTELNIQSKVQEEVEVTDDFDLERFLKKDRKGTPAEHTIEDIINTGLKEGADKGKRTVQVEIVEEPLECAADAHMEFSTPFEVEEAEDTLPGMVGLYGDAEKATTSVVEDLKQKPTVVVSHVEEVSEGDDVVDEEKYFVSTPDERPLAHEQDEGSVYGQIHIEEESTIKYSWQDEFLQGSQTRINEGMVSPERIYQLLGGEAGTFVSKEEPTKEQVTHAESIVIEREVKIPHEFQESIKGLFTQETKSPKHQLKEALEKLEDTLPESVKQELSVLTREDQSDTSSLEVDIKKVEHAKKGGLVTIVAEVSLSQTLDADKFGAEYLGDVVTDEIKSPTRSSSDNGFDEYKKQESESFSDGRKRVGIDVSSTPWTIEEVSSTARLGSSDGTEHHTMEQVIRQVPVFKSVKVDSRGDASPSQESVDINRSIRKIVVGPTEIRRTEQVLYEGPFSETQEFGKGASTNVSQSVKEFKFGPEGTETMEEVIYQGPVYSTVKVSDPESHSQGQFSTDVRSTKHTTLGPKQIFEEVVFQGPISDVSSKEASEALSQTQGPVEVSRSVRQIRIDPMEVSTEQVIFERPLSGFVEVSSVGDHVLTEESVRHIRLGQKDAPIIGQTVYEEPSSKMTQSSHAPDTFFKEGTPDTNKTIRHIKLSPKELVTTTEEIIFTGPISEHLEFGESGQTFSSEGLVRHIKQGQKEVQRSEHVVYQGSVSESSGVSSAGEDLVEAEGPAEISRTFRQIRVSPAETHAEQIVFQGPMSETLRITEHSPTDGPPESNQSVGHIKIGPKETSFTFQMDVSNVAGGRQETIIVAPDWKGADAFQVESKVMGSQKDPESKPRLEESTFDQTAQLQRMVDQRSVISDEKKIALLYLNENEEEEEDEGPWF